MTTDEQLLQAQLWGMRRIARPYIPGGSNNPACEDLEIAWLREQVKAEEEL